jgi:hypothetical protein
MAHAGTVVTAVVLGALALAGCGASGNPDTDTDAGDSGPMVIDTRPRLSDSLEAWKKLSAAMGESYWYEEENCLTNAAGKGGDVTRVQVMGDVAKISTMLATSGECSFKLNRYEDFTAKTFPELYDECAMLLDRHGNEVEIAVDARGVIQKCSYAGGPDCSDNCGEGFFIRAWDFDTHGTGAEPPPDDEIFKDVLVEIDSNQDGFIDELDDVSPMDRKIDTELRHFFNDAAFKKYCVVPDADSFDDFEKVDLATGRIEIPRGITPVSTDCEADGIETGPFQETMIPSSWCKMRDCP